MLPQQYTSKLTLTPFPVVKRKTRQSSIPGRFSSGIYLSLYHWGVTRRAICLSPRSGISLTDAVPSGLKIHHWLTR